MLDIQREVDRFFADQGPLAQRLPGYRRRDAQVEMARAVEDRVLDGGTLIVEAGTGVGKSFGYLVPALLNAVPAGKRVLLSTHTIALQEQLIGKDLPALQGLVPPFRAVLAKGRGNYLAPRRLEQALSQAASDIPGVGPGAELERIASWAEHADEGSLQEIDPRVEPEVWEMVQSEHGNCLGRACSHYESDCFYHRARRRLEDAQVLVVNHSLMLADLALRQSGGRLLPDYDVVVVDEAHTLASVAIDNFGRASAATGWSCSSSASTIPGVDAATFVIMQKGRAPGPWVQRALEASGAFFDALYDFCGGLAATRELDSPYPINDPLSPLLDDLAGELESLAALAKRREEDVELRSYATRVDRLAVELGNVLSRANPDAVHWAETGARVNRVELHARPLDVSAALQELLFECRHAVILTSATLQTGGRDGLDWVGSALGCKDAEQLVVGSPFDYEHRVTLRVPVELSEPRPGREYEEQAAAAALRYLRESDGGAFVLFTSYDFMRRLHRRLLPDLSRDGHPVLLQGEGRSRSRMLEDFKASGRAVLFGTDSFWQGVDVRGEALRCVIITRLPFPVPSQPLFRARCEKLKEEGGHPFRELALPEAIIKFKQGFGRLIRTEEDEGMVCVLDTRILKKSYGRRFLDALPPVPLRTD